MAPLSANRKKGPVQRKLFADARKSKKNSSISKASLFWTIVISSIPTLRFPRDVSNAAVFRDLRSRRGNFRMRPLLRKIFFLPTRNRNMFSYESQS